MKVGKTLALLPAVRPRAHTSVRSVRPSGHLPACALVRLSAFALWILGALIIFTNCAFTSPLCARVPTRLSDSSILLVTQALVLWIGCPPSAFDVLTYLTLLRSSILIILASSWATS